MTEKGLAHRESRKVWIVNSSTLKPELVDAWSRESFGEFPVYYAAGYGVFTLGIDCHEEFHEAYERCMRLVEGRLDDMRREIKRYEAIYSELLNPDYWKPHLNG